MVEDLVVIIPTRNRAKLAINAIRSVLDHPDCDVQILLSDNSTNPEESGALSQFCSQLRNPRLRYVRPPEPLPMPEHWEWAMEQALQVFDASHFTILTDRMIFKPGELKGVIHAARRYPDRVITYNHDRVIDYDRPVRLEQYRWTGILYEVSASHLIDLSAHAIYHNCLPRMLNCVAPRSLLQTLRRRYGNVFDSTAPDFCFCYRCLEMLDSILYYDKTVLIHYALDRSNGASIYRGVMTKDTVDFLDNLGGRQIAYATPIPGLITQNNMIFHEYNLVRADTGSSKFRAIGRERYLEALASDIAQIESQPLKQEMQEVLAAHGWKGPGSNERQPLSLSALFSLPRQLYAGRVSIALKVVSLFTGPHTKPFWLSMARRFRIGPPDHNRFEFESAAEAIQYIVRFPRRRSRGASHLHYVQARPLF